MQVNTIIFKYFLVIVLFSHRFPYATTNNCGKCDPNQDGSNCNGHCQSVTTDIIIKHLINLIRELSEAAESDPCSGTPKPGTDHTTSKPKTTRKPTLTTMFPGGETTKKPTPLTTTTEQHLTTTDSSVVTPCTKRPVDVIILLDVSNSIGPAHFATAKNFVVDLSSAFVRSGKNRLAIIYFSTKPTLHIPLVNTLSPDAILKTIMQIPFEAGRTHTGAAIRMALKEFTRFPKLPETLSQNMIVITDGLSQDDYMRPARDAKKAGVIGYAVGIGGKMEEDDLILMAGGNRSRVFMSDFDHLSTILRDITFDLCNT